VIKCPKCNATFAVGRPQAAPAATADDSYEPEIPLTPSTIVPDDRPAEGLPVAKRFEYEAHWSGDGNLDAEGHHIRPPSAEPDYLKVAKARGLIREEEPDERPRWTFFSGVFLFPWRGLSLTRWTAMSVSLALGGLASLGALDLLGLVTGSLSGSSLMGIPLLMMAVGLMVMSLAYAAACFTSAVQDTADRDSQVREESMPELGQWLFSLGGMMLLASLSGAAGYPLTFIPNVGPWGVIGSAIVLFPILLLSAMERDSLFVPFSGPILRSLGTLWWGWMLFYLITTPLVVGWLALTGYLLVTAFYGTPFLSGPLLATIILVYARLLGRVAWRAAEMPDGGRRENSSAVDEYAPPQLKKKRKRKHKAFPEGLDAAARHLADEP
jgi:hypothetical protein